MCSTFFSFYVSDVQLGIWIHFIKLFIFQRHVLIGYFIVTEWELKEQELEVGAVFLNCAKGKWERDTDRQVENLHSKRYYKTNTTGIGNIFGFYKYYFLV